MAVAEFGPHAKGVELGDQLERLVVGHPRDADALARRHVERLPAGKGMGADDRMRYRRITLDLRLRRRKSAFPAGEIEHRPSAIDTLPKRLWQGIPGRGGIGKFGIP